MAMQQLCGDACPRSRRRAFALQCLYTFLHLCRLRDPIINKVAFRPPSKHGYALDKNGNFILYNYRLPLVYGSDVLRNLGLKCYHVFAPKNGSKRISMLVIHHGDDFESPAELSPGNPPKREFVLFSHGNNTDIGYSFPKCVSLCKNSGVNLLAYDYSGYGLSDGKVGEKHLFKDIEHAYTYLREELHVPPENIILYGNSLGSVTSSYICGKGDRFPVGGMILEAGLASVMRLQAGSCHASCRFDVFDNVKHLKLKALVPTLIMHGTDDTLIPVQHSMYLAQVSEARHAELLGAAAPAEGQSTTSSGESRPSSHDSAGGKPPPPIALEKLPEDYIRTWWVPGANHNNIAIDFEDTYDRTVQTFFQLCKKWRSAKN
ncbi:alpha/beta hydrolase domain-containing protein [Babesia gibsoni]|uniref:Alpha/beta hydrolase domain-containing protein n=1 Tax=Babesia gibsoni TaxID=33632 RepID=A0AAD8UT06_BABGI|nr:alpha/beta hydrolase domain-containing protein [Babesia gibsoni]